MTRRSRGDDEGTAGPAGRSKRGFNGPGYSYIMAGTGVERCHAHEMDALEMRDWAEQPPLAIMAPSNLGLRPPARGGEPGTWRAPQALLDAGLLAALHAVRHLWLPRPRYVGHPEPGSGLLNARAMRRFNLDLADRVSDALAAETTPVVVGGDCSILLGALAGVRRSGPVTLVHIDGHSDFRHPGNYDSAKTPGAVAGMDLALATGRGETIMTTWPGIDGPLVADRNVVQIGERESRDADWAWPDIVASGIERIDIFDVRERGRAWAGDRIEAVIRREPRWRFWVHLDVDVLDERDMPAVDSPGSPGLDPEDLSGLLRDLVHRDGFAGLTLTVFDPDLDSDGRHARTIVSIVRDAFARQRIAT